MIHNEGGITDAEKRSCNEKRRITGSSIWFQIINQIHQQDYARRQKGVAERIVYDAFDLIHSKTGKDPMEVFDAAMKNVMPTLEVKARRVGGANYQVPVEVRADRKTTLGIRWLVNYSRLRGEKDDVRTCCRRTDGRCQQHRCFRQKREDTHKMAEANRAFAHYRW